MWWTSSSGLIELKLTKQQASKGAHQGRCDRDIMELRQVPVIRRQLNKLESSVVVDCLKDYGAWDEKELSDHEANLDRLLWVACGDIVEK